MRLCLMALHSTYCSHPELSFPTSTTVQILACFTEVAKTIMPAISDLSNEILSNIIQSVPREDLQSLALSNKWLHALSHKARKRHLWLERYSVLSFGGYPGVTHGLHKSYDPRVHEDAKDALLLLENIIRDPEITEYAESICLGCCCDDQDDRLSWDLDDEEKATISKRQHVIANRYTELKTLVENCIFITEEEKGKAFDSLCNPRTEGVAVCLALTLLPNLKIVATQDWDRSWTSVRLHEMVLKIAEANQDPRSPFHNQALTHLREFHMNHRDDEDGERIALCVPFAMLPSMRYLGGNDIAGGEDYDRPSPNFGPGSSNVTEVNFQRSAISSDMFDGMLLRGISTLQKFTYHHSELTGLDTPYEPAGYVASLREYAASSLQLLEISARFHFSKPDDTKKWQRVGSLKMFTALRTIRLEDIAFQYPLSSDESEDEYEENASEMDEPEDDQHGEEEPEEHESGKGEPDEHKLENDEREYDEPLEKESLEDGCYSADCPSSNGLIDFLPVSVESLTLVQAMKDRDRRQELLRGLVEKKAEMLPHLKKIMFEGGDPVDDKTKRVLEEAGIIVDSRARIEDY